MYNNKDIDEKRFTKILYKVLEAEKDNLQTKKKTIEAMADLIKNIIISEVKKGF